MTGRHRIVLMLLGATMLGVTALAPVSLGAADTAAQGISTKSIGIIDPDRIVSQYPDYVNLINLKKMYDQQLKDFNTYLASQFQSYAVELDRAKENELEGKSGSEKTAIESKYQDLKDKKQQELGRQYTAKQAELQDKLTEANKKADDKIKAVVALVCQEKGLVFALNKTAVYFGGVDITDEVIAKGKAQTNK